MSYFFLATTIVLIALGQIAQKLASATMANAIGVPSAIRALLRSKEFWIAGVFLALGLFAWLLTLSVLEVSKAYPLLSLSFALTAMLSRWLLREKINGYRWLGIGLISSGAAIMLMTS